MVTAKQCQESCEGKTWEQVATYVNDHAVAYHLQEQLRQPTITVKGPFPVEPKRKLCGLGGDFVLPTNTNEVTPPAEKPAYTGMGSGNASPGRQPRRA
jgi:hypothetical protein